MKKWLHNLKMEVNPELKEELKAQEEAQILIEEQ